MKLLFFIIPLLMLKPKEPSTILVLSGYASGNDAHLNWSFNNDTTISAYIIQRKIKCGNTQNCFETIGEVDGSTYEFITPLNNGKNIFRVIARSIPYPGGTYYWNSNLFSLN
jgi:hypothetical protein